jgi:hypothetical protein
MTSLQHFQFHHQLFKQKLLLLSYSFQKATSEKILVVVNYMMVCQGASSPDPSKHLQLLVWQQNATLIVLEFTCFVLLLSQQTKCFRHYNTCRFFGKCDVGVWTEWS